MKPEIEKISEISINQSVICIIGSDHIPETLALSKTEMQFANDRLMAKDDSVFINSYNKCIYLVRLKERTSHYKVREELRKSASVLLKRIKENNHSELVITSDNAYNCGSILGNIDGNTTNASRTACSPCRQVSYW